MPIEKVCFNNKAEKRVDNILKEIWQILTFHCSGTQIFACFFYFQKLDNDIVDFFIEKCIPNGSYDANYKILETTDFLPQGLTLGKLEQIIKENFKGRKIKACVIRETEQTLMVEVLKAFHIEYEALEKDCKAIDKKIYILSKEVKDLEIKKEFLERSTKDIQEQIFGKHMPSLINSITNCIKEEITKEAIKSKTLLGKIKVETSCLKQDSLF